MGQRKLNGLTIIAACFYNIYIGVSGGTFRRTVIVRL